MKLALIPPFSMLDEATEQKYQLLLPHNFRNHGYASWARDVLDDDEQFTILDNGLAEDKQTEDLALLAMASWYEPSELIVPDVLAECAASIRRAKSFVGMVQEAEEEHPYEGRLAFVAQGKDWQEAFRCAKEYINDGRLGPHVNTIMIPRHLVTAQQPHARLLFAETLHQWMGVPEIQIHLLGGSRYFPDEIKWAAKDYPFIRGMDTSMPFVFGAHGVLIDEAKTGPEHRNDSEDYWTYEFTPVAVSWARYNVQTMKLWAAGEE
jgi:hypothetical protein